VNPWCESGDRFNNVPAIVEHQQHVLVLQDRGNAGRQIRSASPESESARCQVLMQLRSFGTMWQTRRQLTIPARNGRQTIGSVRAKLRGATTAFAKALASRYRA
jgi:hypothetical protein